VNSASEEVSDHELAYEWLELARSIFSKNDTKKSQIRVTNCLMDLVDLKMEDEKFESCKEDLKNAIEIQNKWLDPNDREIASSYYQLGMVEEMLQLPKDAITSYKEAHARLTTLQSLAKDNFANASAEEVGKLKKDIADFKEIIPEVAARIEGCELSIKEYDEVKSTLKDMMKETLTGGSIATTSSSGTSLNAAQPAPVNTLTAKRKNNKRVATEIVNEPSKKQKESDE
jgi:tetratricopeptide (TPR) repeat protein